MAKMLAALAVVMMHGVIAKRSNNWLDDTKHLSVREQSEEEPSMDENQVDVTNKLLQERNVFQWSESDKLPEPGSRAKKWRAILNKPLNVTASAVSFCGELFKEAQHGVPLSNTIHQGIIPTLHLKIEARDAEAFCPKVLTGSLGAADPNAKEWEKDAAEVAQLDGEEHEFGRLDNVPWKKSLHRVCHDECHALVQGIRDKAKQLQIDFFDVLTEKSHSQTSQSVEEICADRVVREVESEIMTCCASSCGWNGRSCMFWPLMNSTEQAAWESECCVEMNILNGSTRERLCDSTLSKRDKEISNAIIDKRKNTAKDREILGQDDETHVVTPVAVTNASHGEIVDKAKNTVPGGWWPRWLSWRGGSFMETSSMRSFNGQCPPPLNLDQLHKEWRTDWKVMNLTDLLNGNVSEGTQKVSKCVRKKKRQASIDGCKIFLLLEPLAETSTTSNEEKQKTYDYRCLDHCDMQEPPPEKVRNIDANSLSANSIVYVHKDTNWTFPKSTS